jgi:transcription antitermination factor NusG
VALPVSAVEMESLRTLVASAENLDPVARLVSGARVRVATGPLRGVTGVVEQERDGKRRLIVQITLLGRGVRTMLAAEDVVEAA